MSVPGFFFSEAHIEQGTNDVELKFWRLKMFNFISISKVESFSQQLPLAFIGLLGSLIF